MSINKNIMNRIDGVIRDIQQTSYGEYCDCDSLRTMLIDLYCDENTDIRKKIESLISKFYDDVGEIYMDIEDKYGDNRKYIYPNDYDELYEMYNKYENEFYRIIGNRRFPDYYDIFNALIGQDKILFEFPPHDIRKYIEFGCDKDGGNYCSYHEYFVDTPFIVLLEVSSSCEICDDNEEYSEYTLLEALELLEDIAKDMKGEDIANEEVEKIRREMYE